jgi:hypothetical protein
MAGWSKSQSLLIGWRGGDGSLVELRIYYTNWREKGACLVDVVMSLHLFSCLWQKRGLEIRQ